MFICLTVCLPDWEVNVETMFIRLSSDFDPSKKYYCIIIVLVAIVDIFTTCSR